MISLSPECIIIVLLHTRKNARVMCYVQRQSLAKTLTYGQDNWPPELVDRGGEQNSPPVIQEEIVSDLPCHLDTHKCMGPDGIHPRMLRELADELAKPLSIIYHQSWLTQEVPGDWKLANVTHPQEEPEGRYGELQAGQPQCTARLWNRSS
ncbi:hypothetical protein WISP_128405 [Willisornis vidua]|uniref:Rna-directed dna polymerase from mobile element jockey-like n=1 Tax=Willisornis vidua TaxID=1566151 RepID=A0ABQ9CQA2_9PASS|nr:hypothetical protein WISP_128405 [Willisornis vidua]